MCLLLLALLLRWVVSIRVGVGRWRIKLLLLLLLLLLGGGRRGPQGDAGLRVLLLMVLLGG